MLSQRCLDEKVSTKISKVFIKRKGTSCIYRSCTALGWYTREAEMKRKTPRGDLVQEEPRAKTWRSSAKYEKSVGGFNFAANTAIVSRLSARRAANKRKSRAARSGRVLAARRSRRARSSLENREQAIESVRYARKRAKQRERERERERESTRFDSSRLDSSRVESSPTEVHAGRERRTSEREIPGETPSHKSRYLIDQRRWHLLRRRCNVITRRGRRRRRACRKGWKTKFSAGGRASELKFAIDERESIL